MTTRVAFVTGAADSREIATGIAERFREFEAIDQTFADAKAHFQTELLELGLTSDEIDLFDRLAAAVIFTNSGLRDRDAVAANRLGQSRLWSHSISGDLPIVLVRVAGADDETVVRQLIRWRIYTLRRGLKLDLVILDERPGQPAERLPKELQTGVAGEMLGKPGGVFFLTADKVPSDEAILLAAVARVVLGGDCGIAGRPDQSRRSAARSIVPIHSECGGGQVGRIARPAA
jgi:cyclic beta-1,2-glucan synthetase